MQGKYSEAEPLYKRALEIDEKSLDKYHPNVAGDLNNLALLYEDQGKYIEAKQLRQRSLYILENKFDKNHHQVKTVKETLKRLQEHIDKSGSNYG